MPPAKNPKRKKQKIIVTSALPYVNNVPHLGTLVCLVSADAYTRFLRLRGENVISVCGTDEHGTTAEVKAMEEGLTPRQLVDKYFRIHREIYSYFGCSFDCFGRTSSEENRELTIDIYQKLDKNGYIAEQEVEQLFCPKCAKFLADRFVEGICPHCGFEDARGDQCSSCGKLLNPNELKDARCKVCGTAPESRKTMHLFIDLPKIEPKLSKWISSAEKNWSQNAATMTHSWLREGLKPRCITRDLKWGIPVPRKGYENKVFYSWFDAPIGYIGITKECRKDWKDWWLDRKTRLVQFMGKDNIPFHTILFPAFLIGTGDPYALVSGLSVNEYLNYEGGAFSKSRNIGVFGDDAIKTGVPPDVWRYYLMINRPETADTEFLWNDFQAKNNNELAANIGNLVNRTMVFLNKFFEGRVGKAKLNDIDRKLIGDIKKGGEKVGELMDAVKLKEALREVMLIGKMVNNYFQKNEPWKLFKEDRERASSCLCVLANCIKDISILISPFMPFTSEKIQSMLNIKSLAWGNIGRMELEEGHAVGAAEILFRKIEDSEIADFSLKHSGKKEQKFPLDLRVAKITGAEPHPDADKLMVLKVDIGPEQRQIVAGIRNFYRAEELIGRNIIIVANLKPAVLRGKESRGMLLAAGSDARLLSAPSSKPGEKVSAEGMASETKEITIEDFAKAGLSVKGKRAAYNGKILKSETEDITVDAKDGEKIR